MYIGFESVDEASLKAMKKSQTAEEMHGAIGLIHAAGIAIHGMFVLGFDTDTPRGVRETVRFAVRERIYSAQFLMLTPLPGSEFYSQMVAEGRILDTDWDNYDAHHVNFRPARVHPLGAADRADEGPRAVLLAAAGRSPAPAGKVRELGDRPVCAGHEQALEAGGTGLPARPALWPPSPCNTRREALTPRGLRGPRSLFPARGGGVCSAQAHPACEPRPLSGNSSDSSA